MKNEALALLIAANELALFFTAFIFIDAVATAAVVATLGLLYYASARMCVEISKEDALEVLKKNISLPAFLLIFYILGLDPSLKLAVVAFSAQAAMKAIAVEISASCGGKQTSSARVRRSFFSSIQRS